MSYNFNLLLAVISYTFDRREKENKLPKVSMEHPVVIPPWSSLPCSFCFLLSTSAVVLLFPCLVTPSASLIHSQSSLPSLFTYFYLHSPPSLSNHLSLSISEGRRREISGDFQASSDVCLHCSTTHCPLHLLSICPLHTRNSKYQQQLIQNRRKHQVFDMKMSTEHA